MFRRKRAKKVIEKPTRGYFLPLERVNKGYSVAGGREKSRETVHFSDAIKHMEPMRLTLKKKNNE